MEEEKEERKITFSCIKKKPNAVIRSGSSNMVVLPEEVSQNTKKTKWVWWEERNEDSEQIFVLHFEWKKLLKIAKEVLNEPIYPRKVKRNYKKDKEKMEVKGNER